MTHMGVGCQVVEGMGPLEGNACLEGVECLFGIHVLARRVNFGTEVFLI